jgi:hypothetical protein
VPLTNLMTTQSNQQAKIDPHRDIPTFSIADPHVEGDVDVIGGEVEVVQGHGLERQVAEREEEAW